MSILNLLARLLRIKIVKIHILAMFMSFWRDLTKTYKKEVAFLLPLLIINQKMFSNIV